ncbi:hypothetical protein CEXT_608331 [Caerostris extrusa]|uniref:Uncharacterized protein n=1 Tax=Caerostris extrusa TaxID=172846 RepID=A0AAV4TBR7_CAEEX|nr:hypothetical protein CEXT_608331 [Caerostris extrusa]
MAIPLEMFNKMPKIGWKGTRTVIYESTSNTQCQASSYIPELESSALAAEWYCRIRATTATTLFYLYETLVHDFGSTLRIVDNPPLQVFSFTKLFVAEACENLFCI